MSANPIWNTAVALGLLHSVAITFLFDAIRRRTGSIVIGLWVVSVLMAQPLWIRYSTIPEAFSALTLVFAGVVWLMSVENLTQRHAYVFAGLLFVGVGTHHMFVLAFPVLGWLFWMLKRWWWILILGSLGGLASYGILLQDSMSIWSWGEPMTAVDVLRYFLRFDYGTFQITHRTTEGAWWGTPLIYLKTLVFESWGVFCLGGLALFGMSCEKNCCCYLGFLAQWGCCHCLGCLQMLSIYHTAIASLFRRWFCGFPLLESVQEGFSLSCRQERFD